MNNLQYLGTLPNIYFWVDKYCQNDDLVVVVGKDEGIIGRQTFKILNSFSRSFNFWYLSSNFV